MDLFGRETANGTKRVRFLIGEFRNARITLSFSWKNRIGLSIESTCTRIKQHHTALNSHQINIFPGFYVVQGHYNQIKLGEIFYIKFLIENRLFKAFYLSLWREFLQDFMHDFRFILADVLFFEIKLTI